MVNVSEQQMYECKLEQQKNNNIITEDLASLKTWHDNMAKEITEFKKETKESLQKIEWIITKWFEKIEEKFVTKTEHKLTTDKVIIIYRIMWTVWWLILARIIWALLKLI